MRKRARRLARLREVQLRELGALVVEMRRLDRENPEVFAYTRNLNGRTVMVALSFSPAGGRTALPAGYAAGKLLMNNLATSPVQGSQLVLGPYQAVVLDLRKG